MTKKITSITDLSNDRKNANKGTPRGRAMIEASLREVGAGRSIVTIATRLESIFGRKIFAQIWTV